MVVLAPPLVDDRVDLGLRRVATIAGEAEPVRLRDQIAPVLRNRPYMTLLATCFLQNIGQAAGYTVGQLPASPEALLDMMMARGVNLPEDRAALRALAGTVNGVPAADYARWFATLPPRTRMTPS